MFFLCPTHRRQLATLSDTEHEALWLRWLNQAGLHYGFHQWRDALPYIGCAYDLSEDALWRSPADKTSPLLRFLLSSLYLINTCHHLGDQRRLAQVRHQSAAYLRQIEADKDLCRLANVYQTVLRDPSRHADFFKDHLNLPFEDATKTHTCH